MRAQVRIYKYLSLFLDNLDKTGLQQNQIDTILDNKQTILKYWKDNPDQRLTQMLFNLFNFGIFNGALYQKECFEYLESIGVPARELVLWGTLSGYYSHELTLIEPVKVWAMSFLLCDGGFNSDNVFQIELKKTTENLKLLKYINNGFFNNTLIKERTREPNGRIKRGTTIYSAYKKEETLKIKEFFKGKKTERQLFNFYSNHIFYFLRGIFDAEGTIQYSESLRHDKYKDIDFNVIISTNLNIGKQLTQILNDFGIYFKEYIKDQSFIIKIGKNIEDKIAFLKELYLNTAIPIKTEKQLKFNKLYEKNLKNRDTEQLQINNPSIIYKNMWLDDMESAHIEAILKTQKNIPPSYTNVFLRELADRGYTASKLADPKYGQPKGKVMLLTDFLEEELDCEFVGNYLDYETAVDIIDDFETHAIVAYVDYVKNSTDTIYFEIDKNLSTKDAISIMLMAAKHRPDELDKVSENVFRLWWN